MALIPLRFSVAPWGSAGSHMLYVASGPTGARAAAIRTCALANAAPALLAALEAALPILDGMNHLDGDEERARAAAQAAAEAAIAAAKGGA
jgi:hypothetical protein